MTTPRQFWAMTKTLYRALRTKPLSEETAMSLGQLVADNAAAFGERPFLSYEGETLSWGAFNARANRYAHELRARGIEKGDCVALMMENRTEFLTALLGITKLGAVAGLLNTNQRRDVLSHSVRLVNAKLLILGEESTSAVDGVRDTLELASNAFLWVPERNTGQPPVWAQAFHSGTSDRATTNPEETGSVIQNDPCFYLFTSGTTGLPKAAVFRNQRLFRAMQGYGRVCLDAGPTDKLYNCLPLYHATGLVVGFGSVAYAGGQMFLRRKFSATSFFQEASREGTNAFIYVGELCRYLLALPKNSDDADNPIQKVIGNGLRPDIWQIFKSRFGISEVYELYGASEGNAGFVNAFNKDETIGFGITPHVLVLFDTDAHEIARDGSGFCIPVESGEVGLLLNEISDSARFDGYTDAEASQKKLVRDVRASGDVYFNTGDLVRQVDVGFAFGKAHYQFVDRTGDTFRWKGENCSTSEVEETLNSFPEVGSANVYGVEIPGTDGRAGMATLTLTRSAEAVSSFDWKAFSAHVAKSLPSYAVPVFLRIAKDQPSTSTFKLQKASLRKEAYHPEACGGEMLLVMRPGESNYVPMDASFYEDLRSQRIRF